MRSQDFHTFLEELETEKRAREFLVFILKWARSSAEDFDIARELPRKQAIELSKEFYSIYVLENIDPPNTTRH